MKTVLPSLLLILCTALVASAQTPGCVAPPSGFVSQYKAEDNGNDSIGINPGILQNGVTFASGEVGRAFRFDGTSGQSVKTSLDVQPSAMPATTWEAWIYPTTANIGTRQTIFGDDDGGNDRTVIIEQGTNNFGIFTGTSTVWQPVAATLNAWQHIAVVYTQTDVLFFKNGIRYSLGAPATGTQSTVKRFTIGSNPSFPLETFIGLIDEVGVYSRALTAGEVQAIYNAGSAGICPAPPVCVPPPSGLISQYSAENNANDSVGTNNGVLVNGTNFAAGKVGQAFALNGANQYVTVNDSPSLRPTSVTVEGWFYFTAPPNNNNTLISKPAGTGPLDSYILYFFNGTLHGAAGGASGIDTLDSGFQPSLNRWYHLAYTFDSGGHTHALFVDGSQLTSAVTNRTISYDNHALLIGAESENEVIQFFFPGRIDEASVYNRALSPVEIQSIYDAGSQGKCTAPLPPPHGGLSQTRFTVNGSATPTANLADTVLHFAAEQTGRPAGLFCRVQSSQMPNVESSWTDLSDGNSGRMTYNSALGRFVLNSTNYPALNGVYFRVIGAAQGYPDSISTPIGPFNLSSTSARLASPKLTFLRNTTVADMYFHVRMPSLLSGTSVRVQATTTPGTESSWTNLANGNGGLMTQSTDPNTFLLLMNQYPAVDHVYFRAIASAPGALDGISTTLGSYTITAHNPPTVSITLPPGTGTGTTAADPRIVTSGLLTFSATATSPERNISSLQLLLHGKPLGPPAPSGGSSVTIQYSTSAIGSGNDYVIDALAIDDAQCRARAGTNPLYLRVVPAPGPVSGDGSDSVTVVGKVFTLVADGGTWENAASWRDANGNVGVPSIDDLAIVGTKTVYIPTFAVVKSLLILTGGRIVGPGTLDVYGILTVAGGTFENARVTIRSTATLYLTNDGDVQFGGLINNFGTISVRGSAGLRGVTTLSGPGKVNFQTPLTIAPNAALDPAAGVRTLSATNLQLSAGLLQGSASIVSHDGGSFTLHDGGSLISLAGGSLISQDGSGLVAAGAGNLIAAGAGNLVAAGAGNLVAAGAGNASTPRGDGKGAADQPATDGVTLDGGEIDLTDVTVVAPVMMNSGTLSGSGTIIGDVTNSGGRVAPGQSSAGAITVEGSYTQGAGGTLAIENGGRDPLQFDQLTATGAVSLGGNLEVQNINGYTPDPMDTLNPIGFSSATGSFATVSGNAQVAVAQTGALLAVAPDALAMTGAVSRKTHGTAGTFDIALPSTGTRGVECRTGGANGNHTLVVSFNNNLASGAATVTAGSGSVVGTPTVNGTSLTVDLTGVTNAQNVTVTLSNVTDTASQVLPSTSVTVGFLVGDTNGDGIVNSGDSLQTRNRAGQVTSATNFRSDVNEDGFVNSGDSTIVRARSGTALP
ncbi:MAG: dockerin type I domain-containing protein [Verrucomicrobiota bacterium]|nr:dockerin type I domain-containing protein [Verrucomicrobiota bacterium]